MAEGVGLAGTLPADVLDMDQVARRSRARNSIQAGPCSKSHEMSVVKLYDIAT
jgi:hypothetical protein